MPPRPHRPGVQEPPAAPRNEVYTDGVGWQTVEQTVSQFPFKPEPVKEKDMSSITSTRPSIKMNLKPGTAAGHISGKAASKSKENTVSDTNTAVAEKPVAAPKKSAVPAKAKAAPVVKKGAKAAPAPVKKAAKKETESRGPSIRLRTFELLAKNSSGLSGADIQKKLELGGIPALLKDEGLRDKKPRIVREKLEDVRGVVYKLTDAGKQALKDGTVDTEAAEKAAGKDWGNR